MNDLVVTRPGDVKTFVYVIEVMLSVIAQSVMNRGSRNAMLIASAANIIFSVCFDDEEEEEEDTWIQLNVIQCLASEHRGKKPPRILNYFEQTIPSLNDKTFQSHFRLTREAFQTIYTAIAPRLQAKPNAHKPTIDAEKQLLMVIWLLATPESYRSVGERFDVAKSTLWMCFVRVVNALNHVAPVFIKWPEADERKCIALNFRRFAGIPHIVGAIDGTYIPISAPHENAEVYINRKCFHGITLQGIGVPSLKFIDCFTGYPSSVSDIRVFRNSDIHRQICEMPAIYFDEDEFLIGDKAYPVYKWCIPPYINRGNLSELEIRFNTMQAKSRQVIERVFALFFGRLRRMQHLDLHRDDLYASTILAACVLHNVCLLKPDEEVNHYITEGLPVVREMQEIANNNLAAEHAIVYNVREGLNRRSQLTRNLRR